MERISIIIPVYNTEQYVEATVRSIMEQTYDNLEIICVNDGSTDGSLTVLNRLRDEDPRIIVIDQKNTGQGAARNAGLEVASSEWISFIDSDDQLAPDAYEIISKTFSQNPDMIHFGIKVVSEDGSTPEDSDIKYYNLKYEGMVKLNDSVILRSDASASNKIFRKSVLDKYGIRFSKILFEDFQFSMQYMSVVENVYYIKDKLYYYLRRDGSTMSQTFNRSERAIHHMYAFDNLADFIYKNNLQDEHRRMLYKLFISSYMFSIRYTTLELIPDVVDYSTKLHIKYPVLHHKVKRKIENGSVRFVVKKKRRIHSVVLHKLASLNYEFIDYRLYKVLRVCGIILYKKARYK